MRLFINAINLSSAGGLNVTLNFLKCLNAHRPHGWEVHVVAPRHCGYEALPTDWLRIIWRPNGFTNWVARLYTDYGWVPSLLEKIDPDIVFTMGNFATPTAIRQVLLLQNAHLIYHNERNVRKRLNWRRTVDKRVRNYVFGQRLKYADVLLVQTETMRKRIQQIYPQQSSVYLFPNAYTQLAAQTDYQLPFVREPDVRYLMCLSRYYTSKNIEILVDVARLIQQRNLPYRILLTIDAGQHPNARRLLNGIRHGRLTNVIINIGTVPATSVRSLHGQVNGLVLPTLLESFSATYVDAMHFGLPIFTSRRDFSEEICGDCAYYFDPLSAEDILSTIDAGFRNPTVMQQKIQRGRLRSATMPDWATVMQLGVDAIESLK